MRDDSLPTTSVRVTCAFRVRSDTRELLLRIPGREPAEADFERLQGRLRIRGTGAARLAGEWPVHYVAFDLLCWEGTDTTRWAYRRRRAALEELFPGAPN
ncbi:hypothetical protein SHJG_p1154 (plasmid) [Streptomyces hygroscopicus subsp. jinggangensis 5008]|nr:hypothetical protein SHJG_p1154 [Streptomyces hygroscopicus subsp. jinggangensis 5008]AGF68439.1 hypothetical protein SHJGH_p1154 [Streptomyces hygroscopicus subsp. jinggangensis TL01]